MPPDDLLKQALDTAFARHFCKLFEVLMADPTEAGLGRFVKGLDNTCRIYDSVAEMIDHQDFGD